MARGSRPAKVQEWRDRLKRFEESSTSVAEFCETEGVSQQSYYHWKRKLRDAAVAPSPRSRFQAVRVLPAGRLPSEPTTIQLGKGIHIELGSDLPVAEQVVKQVLDVVLDADRHPATTPTKAK
jgi:hypothetical protein